MSQGKTTEWTDKAMELATDFAIESLRVGSHERARTHGGSSDWQVKMLREKRDSARERLRQHLYSPQLEDGPPGSGGWEAYSKELEKELAHWKRRAQMMFEHQQGEVWYWQGDGQDHPKSMANSLPVVIRADDLRELLAATTSKPLRGEVIVDLARSCAPKAVGFIDVPTWIVSFARAVEFEHGIKVEPA